MLLLYIKLKEIPSIHFGRKLYHFLIILQKIKTTSNIFSKNMLNKIKYVNRCLQFCTKIIPLQQNLLQLSGQDKNCLNQFFLLGVGKFPACRVPIVVDRRRLFTGRKVEQNFYFRKFSVGRRKGFWESRFLTDTNRLLPTFKMTPFCVFVNILYIFLST
jgi:hypothetical protein